jgi:transposase
MARAYSLDLRERVVGAVLRGLSCRAVAALFNVSAASVVKWAQRARETGSPAARVMGGKRPYLLAGQRGFLLARLAEKARSDAAYAPKRTWRARRDRVLRYPLALSAPPGRFQF